MIENRNVNIITDADGKKLVLINDIRFKGKRQIDWNDVKQYLEGYVGDYYEIAENAEHIFIGSELPEEYTESESRKSLMGANAKAKANAATAIPELIQIASNPAFEENRKEKHNKNAKLAYVHLWILINRKFHILYIAAILQKRLCFMQNLKRTL